MANSTSNLGLNQYANTDPVITAAEYSSDMQKIDTAVGLFQSGSVQLNITANTVASTSVTFPKAYASNPIVVLTSNSSNVQFNVSLGISGLSTTKFTVYAYSTSNVGSWYVYWISMPRG